MLDAIEDGQDRVGLAWPFVPMNGFAAAAMALREARTSGRLAHATFAFWLWRAGATFGARWILVQPDNIQHAAAKIVTELRAAQSWASPLLGHESQCMLDLRLSDLKPPTSGSAAVRSVLVRSPTVLETTSDHRLKIIWHRLRSQYMPVSGAWSDGTSKVPCGPRVCTSCAAQALESQGTIAITDVSGWLADRAGFEPAIRFPVYTLSRRAPSTTRPPVRGGR